MKKIKIGNCWIGEGYPTYAIAEIGGNFCNFQDAKRLIDLAVAAQVNAVKLQHYRAETVTSKEAIFEMENTGLASQYEFFKKYELSEDLTAKVLAYCRKKNITAFSTPSHQTDVDSLRKFKMPAYKIGSDDAVNIPFLKYVARMKKPVILSTGMCTLGEVQRAVDAILEEENDQIVILHCTTNYPTHPASVNLRAMVTLQNHFPFPVGYSDHTLGIDTCYAAAVLGARVVEFHLTYDQEAEGPDHMLSKNGKEASELIRKIRLLPVMLGNGIKRPMPTEMNTRKNNRKSLVVTRAIGKGERLSFDNVAIKRPGYGIPCEHYYSVLGKTAGRAIRADSVLQWEDLAGSESPSKLLR